jgi:hypothetical protein
MSSIILALALGLVPGDPLLSPAELWDAWPSARILRMPAPCLRNAELLEGLAALQERHPRHLQVEEVGRSVQGRPIHLLTIGTGPKRVLLWSQMHGDEPSATPALLDMAHFLLSSPDPAASALLDGATLLMVPMLNPDGAEHYVRRNAQAIDINRDALQLSTPEGRLLESLRARFEPALGFNLHDQSRRTTVRNSGHLATISVLAVAGDEAGTLTPGRARARRAASAIVRAVEPFVPGGIARYDEDWNPRAFGDNITAWGTPVVLVESGGRPPGGTYEDLTRLNFVALLTVLQGLVADDLAGEDPERYELLERNEDGLWVDVLVSGGEVWQPGAGPPYRADVAFDRLDRDPVLAACDVAGPPGPSQVREIGDGRFLGASRTIDASGCLIVPAFEASLEGLAAREWLDAGTLFSLGHLGVSRLLWRVEPAGQGEALAVAASLEEPGRPALEVTPLDGPCLLALDGPPESPRSLRLDQVLDALSRGHWRSRARGLSFGELLPSLNRCSPQESGEPVLVPEGPASLLLMRPRSAGAQEAEELDLEAVFIDGRAFGGEE